MSEPLHVAVFFYKRLEDGHGITVILIIITSHIGFAVRHKCIKKTHLKVNNINTHTLEMGRVEDAGKCARMCTHTHTHTHQLKHISHSNTHTHTHTHK